jgi:hypothetical protein
LLLEEDRRTPEGRIRSSKQFREHFFPYDERSSTDRIFARMPNDVRGPILAAWGVRGPKSAVKDTDEKVVSVVHDALVAGDLDDFFFEEGLVPGVVVRWADLPDWWAFWREGPLAKRAIRQALEIGYHLGLYDATWFLAALETRGGALRGTDVLAASMTKADLTEWIGAIHASGDGSPKGLVEALGWEKIVARCSDDVLCGLLDALASRIGLTADAGGSAAVDEGEAPDELEAALSEKDLAVVSAARPS